MKKRLFAVLLISLLLLSGCGTVSLEDDETQSVGNGDFTLTIPAGWSSIQPSTENGLLAFTSGDGLELQIIGQLGSMEYYAADELCQLFAERVEESLFAEDAQWETLAEGDNIYSCLLTGPTEGGEMAACRLDLLMPYPSVHYLLLYTAGAETYATYAKLSDEVLQSFTMTKSAEQMYQQIDAAREKEAEEAAEALMQEMSENGEASNEDADNDGGAQSE